MGTALHVPIATLNHASSVEERSRSTVHWNPVIPHPASTSDRAWALGWFAGALGVYGLSAARGPMWADSSKLTLYALARYFPSLNPGDHPGWTVIANTWLFLTGWLGPVRALPLLSAAGGATAVALMYLIVARWSGDRSRGHGAAAVLLAAHSLWWPSALTESYAPALALALAALLLADLPGTARELAAGVATGLAAAAHPFTLVLTAPMLVARWRRPGLWAGVLLGASPVWLGFLGTPADPLTGHAAGHAAAWSWHIHQFLDLHRLRHGVLVVAGMAGLSLGPIGLWGVGRGVLDRSSHPNRLAACAALALYVLLLLAYSPFRLHLMVLFAVTGLVLLAPPRLAPGHRMAHVAVQTAIYLSLPLVAGLAGRSDLGVRRLPDRNNAWYFLCPIKAFDAGPDRYAHALLRAAPPRGVIMADFNPGAVLVLVQRTEKLRPDILIRPTVVDEILGRSDPAASIVTLIEDQLGQGRPVVLADRWEPYYHASEIERRFPITLIPCGPGWRVMRSHTNPPRSAPIGKAVMPLVTTRANILGRTR